MPLVAGIDIDNATTEAALMQDGRLIASGIAAAAGVKGTWDNIAEVVAPLQQALDRTPWSLQDVAKICINGVTPVIGDVVMETITEAIITEPTMIDRNPQAPGSAGVGMGTTIAMEKLAVLNEDRFAQGWILLVGEGMDSLEVVRFIDEALDRDVNVVAAILKEDDSVLMNNCLCRPIPVVDEVILLERVPESVLAAVEMAAPGRVVRVLSNPYGTATFFALTPGETQATTPIARALIGNHSAMVLKTPQGDVRLKVIPADKIFIRDEKRGGKTDVVRGTQAIMQATNACASVCDIRGEAGTHAGGMLERVCKVMASPTDHGTNTVHIQDLLAVDTFVPRKVQGSTAGECSMENVVGTTAMMKADRLQMQAIASGLNVRLDTLAEMGGVEANMAVVGALTAPGCVALLTILDLGTGSTDAAVINGDGVAKAVHLAGAGNMVSLLIQTELDLGDASLAKEVKKYPLAKVENLFSIRHENGAVELFRESLSPLVLAKVVYLREGELILADNQISLEKTRLVRRQAKEKVFATNCLHALRQVSPGGSICNMMLVVLVGGSSSDFEIPQMITDVPVHYGVVAGQGNIQDTEEPRNAVATGLVLAGEAKK